MATNNNKPLVASKKEVIINIPPSHYHWNRVDKSKKTWDTPREQSFQYFRFAIFNAVGDYGMHAHVFKMLIEIGKKQTESEFVNNVTIYDNNVGFQIGDALILTNYIKRLQPFYNTKKEIDFKELFSDSELLDMKLRLYKYTRQYYVLMGCPGYIPAKIVKDEDRATEADIKKNDAVIDFLKQFE